MDPGAKPKRLRSFLVEDILGLDKNDTGDIHGNCRSHYNHQNSRTHPRQPADSLTQYTKSSSCYQIEEKSKSDDFEWQGETLFCFRNLSVHSSLTIAY